MADYRGMFDRDFIGSWDLNGQDVVVTIARVEAKELIGTKGVKAKKPVIHFVGKEKGLCCNKTNAKCIAAMYGNDTDNWVGKKVTLYPTTTNMGGDAVDCVRIRPGIPKEPNESAKEKPRAVA